MNALLKFMKEHEVNAYTHHSHKSHTVLNNYYHLDENWAGQQLALVSASGDKVVAMSEEAQAIMQADDQEADSDDKEVEADANPLQALVDRITTAKDHAQANAGGAEPNKKAEKADLREKATEVVAKDQHKCRADNCFLRAEGPSTTLAKAASGGFFGDRKGEVRNSTARSSVSFLPTEVFKEDVRSSLGECPNPRLPAVVCPPGTDAQAAATRLVKSRKRK
jgi:hypothetical protein